ncbi:MAG: nucleotidyltransferase family protein [Campylobacterales bacterium]
MPTRDIVLSVLKQVKPDIEAKYHINSLALFGSVARGDDNANSDVDLLVEFSTAPDLLTFIELEERLKAALGRNVDLVPRRKLRAELADSILREAVAV